MLGPRFCARAFSSCGERGPLFIAVHGPLTVAASPVAEHRLQTRRLSSCGSRAQTLRGMWDPPRPGLEPVSPELTGRFLTTAPPGKPRAYLSLCSFFMLIPSIITCSFTCVPTSFSLHGGIFLCVLFIVRVSHSRLSSLRVLRTMGYLSLHASAKNSA